MDEQDDTLDTVPPKKHRSYSQFSLFQRCSLAYYYRYILQWKERPSLALANGKAGHAAVEKTLQYKLDSEGQLPELEVVLDTFSDEYKKETEALEPGDLDEGQDIGKTKDQTVALLNLYLNTEAPLITPIAVEAEFTIDIPRTEDFDFDVPQVVGRIDRVSKSPRQRPQGRTLTDAWKNVTSTEVMDSKFVQRIQSQGKIDMSDQLTLYDMHMHQIGLPTDRLGHELFIPPNTRNPARIIPIIRSDAMMTPDIRANRHDRLLYKMRTIERAIQSGIFIPTDDPVICAYCGFNTVCQASKVTEWQALQIRQRNAAGVPRDGEADPT